MYLFSNDKGFIGIHSLRYRGRDDFHSNKRNNQGFEEIIEACAHIGISKSYLWELERGGCQPTLGVLLKILKHYAISIDEIDDDIT